MLAHSLEFAPNTAEDCKKIIVGMFDPKYLLTLYRAARRQHATHDLVLVCPNMDPDEVFAGPRVTMRDHLQRKFKFPGKMESAHSIVKLPHDSDAFWVLVPVPKHDFPVMAVMFAMPYEMVAPGKTLTGEN